MPETPVVLPKIPVGFATKFGVFATVAAAAVAAVTAILNGDHSDETIGALVTAGATAFALIKGRSEQAASAYAAAIAPQVVEATSGVIAAGEHAFEVGRGIYDAETAKTPELEQPEFEEPTAPVGLNPNAPKE